jgi:tRNA A37 threonylcarbamoyladenosine modification protein TsaB
LILFSSEIEFELKNRIKMNKLIIDAASEKIFLMIISNGSIYNITHENTKINYEKLTMIINDFLSSKNIKIAYISAIYINQGSGSFAGIRNSMSVVKAFNVAKNIDYYCYNLDDFKDEKDLRHENIPNLCKKYKIKKNLINPVYLS